MSDRELILFVETNSHHEWLYELVEYLVINNESKITLMTLEKVGPLHKYFSSHKEITTLSFYSRPIKGLRYLLNSTDRTHLYVLGHKPSLFVSLLSIIKKINFTICFVQQVDYFTLMKSRDSLTSKIRGVIHEILMKWYTNNANYVQSLCDDTLRKFKELEIEDEKIINIPLGVKFSHLFNPEIIQGSDTILVGHKVTQPYVLSVGRLAWEKRHQDSIEVFEQFLQKHPEYTFIIAGIGDQEKILQEDIENRGLAGKVKLIGFTRNIQELIANCDLFIHAAITESYGLVLMEARVCNKPIVTRKVGVAHDMLRLADPNVWLDDFADKFKSAVIWEKAIIKSRALSEFDFSRLYANHDVSAVYRELSMHFKKIL